MTPRLNVCFKDFWKGFDTQDNFVMRALNQSFEVEVGDEGELCIFSVYGRSHETFNGPKIQVISEPKSPDWRNTDFAIGFDRLMRSNYLRFPSWAWDTCSVEDLRKPLSELRGTGRRDFCLFLVHNPDSPIRNAIFQGLDDRRAVTSPGAVLNNAPPIGERFANSWREEKIKAVRGYRFCIAAENCQMVGYTSEKIADAFLGGAIPIYWGDPLVDVDFDGRCFMNLASFGSVSELADRVVELDDNESELQSRLEFSPLTRRGYEEAARFERVESFLRSAVKTSRLHPNRAAWRHRAHVGRLAWIARRTSLGKIRRIL